MRVLYQVHLEDCTQDHTQTTNKTQCVKLFMVRQEVALPMEYVFSLAAHLILMRRRGWSECLAYSLAEPRTAA